MLVRINNLMFIETRSVNDDDMAEAVGIGLRDMVARGRFKLTRDDKIRNVYHVDYGEITLKEYVMNELDKTLKDEK